MPQSNNFELKTELISLVRRPFPVADRKILLPNYSRAVVDGEWLELVNYKLARGGDNNATTVDEGTNAMVFPVHEVRGATDIQAILKPSVLFLGPWEADTLIIDPAGLAVGDGLTVQDVSFGGVVRRALKKATGTASTVVVAYVSKTAAVSGGPTRVVHTGNQKIF